MLLRPRFNEAWTRRRTAVVGDAVPGGHSCSFSAANIRPLNASILSPPALYAVAHARKGWRELNMLPLRSEGRRVNV